MSARLALDCARAQELLSDHLEGLLEEPLRGDLQGHLAGCPACSELAQALWQVMEALHAAAGAAEPSRDLAERAAAAALRAAWSARKAARTAWAWPQSPRALAAVRGLAAALAVATTVALYLGPETLTRPARLFDRTVRAGAYIAERKDHLVEDFRLLRVVITNAFEVRLDRVNDRVDDYRRLIERRREAPPAPPAPPLPLGQAEPTSSNFTGPDRVEGVTAQTTARRRARRT
jgi:anti-sigma factor RsiW